MESIEQRDTIDAILTETVAEGGAVHAVTPDYSLPPQPGSCSLPWPRIMLVRSGVMSTICCMDGKEIKVDVEPGGCLVHSPWSWSRYRRPMINSSLGLVFRDGYIRYLYGISLDPEDPFPSTNYWYHTSRPPAKTTQRVLDSLMDLSHAKHDPQTILLLLNALLRLCLDELRNDETRPVSKATFTLKNICSYLQEHFHEPISRDSVAELMKLSPNYLSRLFHERSGQTFSQYLQQLRLNHSRELLKDHRLTVQEVALMSGYNEVRHFIRTFKQAFGQTPGSWRSRKALQA